MIHKGSPVKRNISCRDCIHFYFNTDSCNNPNSYEYNRIVYHNTGCEHYKLKQDVLVKTINISKQN